MLKSVCEKLVGGFLREQADPHLDKGVARLKQLKELLDRLEDQDSLKRGMRRHDIYQFGIGK